MKLLTNFKLLLGVFCASVGLSVYSAIPSLQLMKPRHADPSSMEVIEKVGTDAFNLFTGCTDNDTKEWTAISWIRLRSDRFTSRDNALYGSTFYNVSFASFYSTRRGISSSEGSKHSLSNLCTHAYDTELKLITGGWAKANILPTTYDDGNSGLEAWSNGCYAVNIETDTDLTLVVGGYEKRVEASTEKQVFNIQCTSSDRSVSIAADDAEAHIKFGIAENPLVEFHGDQISCMSGSGGSCENDPTEGFIGINPWEYTCFVIRARVNDDLTISNQLSVLYFDTDHWHMESKSVIDPQWKTPEAKFGDESRIAAQCFAPGGVIGRSALIYGTKIYKGWLSDAQVSEIRDVDYAEMRRKGISFTRDEDGFYQWTVTSKQNSDVVIGSNVSTGTGTSGKSMDDSTDVLKYDTYTRNYNNVRTATFEINNLVTANCIEYSANDMRYGCPTDGVVFTNNVAYFPTSGVFCVNVEDPCGNTRTNTVTITDINNKVMYGVTYTSDVAGWQKNCNDSVVNALTTADNDGNSYSAKHYGVPFNFNKWNTKRITSMPLVSSAGFTGNRGMCVLSPHVYASSAYHDYYVGGTQIYKSLDNTITSVVTTKDDMVNLKQWALAHASEYGWTTEQINAAQCDDIVVNTFADGTVDASLCPYFITEETVSNKFASASVLGWCGTQYYSGFGMPVAFDPTSMFTKYQTASTIEKWVSTKITESVAVDMTGLVRADVVTTVSNLKPADGWLFPRTSSKDFGLPLYLDYGEGKFIIVSHCSTPDLNGNYPSYIKSAFILQKYIEAAGDTFKTLE